LLHASLRALLVVLVLAPALCVQAQQHVRGTSIWSASKSFHWITDGAFIPGDDPRWADLAFDDSHWPVLHDKDGLVGSRLLRGCQVSAGIERD